MVAKFYDLGLKQITKKNESTTTLLIVTTAALAAFVAYLMAVHSLRYKNLRMLREKYPNPDDILNDSEAANFVYNIHHSKRISL